MFRALSNVDKMYLACFVADGLTQWVMNATFLLLEILFFYIRNSLGG